MFGHVQFTTQAVHQLFDHGIEMALLTRTGKLKGHLVSPSTKNIQLRLAQFRKYEDPDFRMAVSKAFLEGKLKNGLTFVRKFLKNHPLVDLSHEVEGLTEGLKASGRAQSLQELFGIEGTAASHHFKALGKMVLGEFAFSRRSKRPPEDPANALLSFTYTLVFNEIASLLDGLGFDPYLGFYHHPSYGRASLAADLMEEFRAPVADRFVLNLINRKTLKTEDFYIRENGGFYLKRDPMKRYFSEFEAFLNAGFSMNSGRTSFRKSFRSQAEKMARCLQGEDTYTPFIAKA
ncbi:crispr-associated protein cas1 [Desulfoluna butyratoxydans]|uniref:CRISPR-associated endonuclease Cas1 n=2 Tax=Desulfoluna butyratoxydans TaxID=231438 RepID=A0A4U8YPJ1_9BACT|nr:crispr-associated protein cas1 [Desulfoluna butyratoxydans]